MLTNPNTGHDRDGCNRRLVAGQRHNHSLKRRASPILAHSRPARSALAPVTELSTAELNAMVEEATIDAHDEDEQLSGFYDMIEDNLAVPFETTVLGVTVTVDGISQTSAGIVANCVRGEHRQAMHVLDLPLPVPPPPGAEWITAYRRWARWQ
ncbi:MAG: hypothetical protein ACRDNT_24690 [Streptosporangiaceae bacterium]